MVGVNIKVKASVRIFGDVRRYEDELTESFYSYFNDFMSGVVGQPKSVYVVVQPGQIQIPLTDVSYSASATGLTLSLQFLYRGTVSLVSNVYLNVVDSNGVTRNVAQFNLPNFLTNVTNLLVVWTFEFTYSPCSNCELYSDNLSSLLVAMFTPSSMSYGYGTSVTPSQPSIQCQPVAPSVTTYQGASVSALLSTTPNQQLTITCDVYFNNVLVLTFTNTLTTQSVTLATASLTVNET